LFLTPVTSSLSILVLAIQTGWITIEPDTDDSIEENGFVLVKNGEMKCQFIIFGANNV
jgi:hypothetical protein